MRHPFADSHCLKIVPTLDENSLATKRDQAWQGNLAGVNLLDFCNDAALLHNSHTQELAQL